MTGQAPATRAGPVQAPAAPTHTGLIWATGTTAAALHNGSSLAHVQACAEAEQATCTAARHRGLAGSTPQAYTAEQEAMTTQAMGVEGNPDSPCLAGWARTVQVPEAGL